MTVDKVREALLSGKNCKEVNDIASQYSNQRHIQYLKTTIDKENRPGGSDVEAQGCIKYFIFWDHKANENIFCTQTPGI
jgi:hypothetical protein